MKDNYIKKYGKSLLFTLLIMLLTWVSIFRNHEIPELFEALHNIEPQYLLLGVVGMGAFFLCQSLAIKLLINSFGYDASIGHCARYSLIDFYFSSITPGCVGGQPSEIYYMKKDGIKVGSGSLAMLILNGIYHLAVLIVAGSSLLLGGMSVLEQMGNFRIFFYYGAIAQIFLSSCFCLLIFSKKLAPHILHKGIDLLVKIRLIKNVEKWHKRAEHNIDEYHLGAEYIKQNPTILMRLLLLGILQITLLYSTPFWVYKGMGLTGHGYFSILAIQAALTMSIESLPIPGGMGIAEGGFISLYSLVFGHKNVVAAMLITRGISYYFSLAFSAVITAFSRGSRVKRRKITQQNI